MYSKREMLVFYLKDGFESGSLWLNFSASSGLIALLRWLSAASCLECSLTGKHLLRKREFKRLLKNQEGVPSEFM